MAVIYVGKTDTGKSTLIGLRDGVTTGSDGSVSDTQGCALTVDTQSGIKLLDTQGFSDSECKISDEEISADVFRSMKTNNLTNVTIVWTIRSGNRSEPHLKKEAQFIHNLGAPMGSVTTRKDIWKSVVIICNQGSDQRSFNGALAAANALRSNTDHSIVCRNLTILDYLSSDNWVVDYAATLNNAARSERGLMYKRETAQWQRALLETVDSTQISFANVSCNRCNANGDPRAIAPDCHRSFQHNGALEWIYRTETHTNSRTVYDSRVEHFHDGKWDWHLGAATAGTLNQYVNPAGWVASAFKKGRKEFRKSRSSFWHCCDSYDRNSRGCKSRTIQMPRTVTDTVSNQVRDYQRWTGCGCREGTDINNCTQSVCIICAQPKGNQSNNCGGIHSFGHL